MRHLTRREGISIIATGTFLGLSGCAQTLQTGPNPDVLDVEVDRGLTGAFTGNVTIKALIRNNGDDGAVQVELNIFNSVGTTIDTHTRTVSMRSDSQRTVEFDVSLSSEADSYEVLAEPA